MEILYENERKNPHRKRRSVKIGETCQLFWARTSIPRELIGILGGLGRKESQIVPYQKGLATN